MLVKQLKMKQKNKKANEAKKQKGKFFGMLIGTLAANILGNILAGKAAIWDGEKVIATTVKDKVRLELVRI